MAVARLMLLVGSLALLVGAACSGADDPGPTATVPTAVTSPSSTSSAPSSVTDTTVAADSFAIPEVIDIAYVNRVLAALYAIDGDAVRSVISTRRVELEDILKYTAIYAEPQRTIEINDLRRLFDADLSNFRRPPGDRRTRVSRLKSVTEQCIVAEVVFDFAEVVITPEPPPIDEIGIIALVPTAAADDERNLNPTPWSIIDAEYVPVGKEPDRPCE